MGIRKYNDMKEHSISRIQSIRHPSPANTHQSPCAHNLITKCITTAKQPRYFNATVLIQTKRWQLFLLLKTCQLEDCGGAERIVILWKLHFFHIVIIILIMSWHDFNTKKLQYFLLLHLPKLIFFSFFLVYLRLAQWCTKTAERTVQKSGANWPWSQCELWVWSGQFPAEATFPLQKSGCTHPEYCLPTEEAFRHLEGPAINPDTNATRMVPGQSSRSVHSNNRASANPTGQGKSLPV